jgi:hypothetical protein
VNNGIRTPHAQVIVWNYAVRASADNLPTNSTKVEETILLGSSLTKISTSKSKSSPNGAFEFGLAPTHNWVSRITPGSWCAILMSPNEKLPQDPKNIGSVSQSTLKMVGRIDSVRSILSLDGEGNRVLSYIATGTDWGSVFTTSVYVDPLILTAGQSSVGAVGEAMSRLYADFLNSVRAKSPGLPSTTDNIKNLIGFWSTAGDNVTKNIKNAGPVLSSLVMNASQQYEMPKQMVQYLGIRSTDPKEFNKPTTNISKAINVVPGVLKSYDKYEDFADSYNIIDPNSVLDEHSLWQLLNANCNNILNELVVEMRWPSTNNASFTLYKRVRPFLTRTPKNLPPNAKNNASYMKDVRSHVILSTDAISCNAGTNWRDNVNFIEIMPTVPLDSLQYLNSQAKLEAQTADTQGFSRDGFRSMRLKTSQILFADRKSNEYTEVDFIGATQWKHLLREWYFNTQNLLNGSITFVGQGVYIGVGDNLLIDSSVLGMAPLASNQGPDTYLMAHIENISHEFTINSEGSRSFFTSVQFVRGIMVNAKREPINPQTGIALDRESSSLSEDQEKPSNVVFSGS